MAELLKRHDLPAGDAEWWMVVVSVCNSGLLSAEAGAADAEQWAGLLVQALDEAAKLGALTQEETLHRRMIACAAALQYFGIRRGDPVRDPEAGFVWLRDRLGGSSDEFVEELVGIQSAYARGTLTGPPLRRGMKRLSSVRMALEALARVLPYMADGPQKQDAEAWCALLDQIPGGRPGKAGRSLAADDSVP